MSGIIPVIHPKYDIIPLDINVEFHGILHYQHQSTRHPIGNGKRIEDMGIQMRYNNDEHPKMYLYRRIVAAKVFIDEHYDQKLDLAHLSAQACFSKFHFLRTFKTAYGKSPHQYLTQVRIEAAKALLKQRRISVTDVCIRVGFESTPSFIHLFKKNTGVSPDAFRKNHDQEMKSMAQSPLSFVPGCFAASNGWSK